MSRKLVLLIAGIALLTGGVLAAEKELLEIDQRIAPPSFVPLDGAYCSQPGMAIPDADSGAAVDTITVTESGFITDLDVALQIERTWIGDLRAEVTNGSCTIQLVHRIGLDGDDCCGCSGDDIDIILDDSAAASVEGSCGSGGSGGAGGSWQPGDPSPNGIWPTAMSDCNGQDINGNWTLTVTDGAGGDTGTVLQWCLISKDGGGDDGGDGGGVPATTGLGLVLLVLAVGGGSAYFLRRK